MSGYSAGGFETFLDAIEAEEPFALTCPQGHGSLPPQEICPECQSQELSREQLPKTGTVATFTVVAVPSPRFSDDAPYVTAIAEFGPVHVTGQVRGTAPDDGALEQEVSLTVERTDDQRLVVFRQR